MSNTETPEQWADRIYRHCRAYPPGSENARRTLDELAEVRRAVKLWRDEALAARAMLEVPKPRRCDAYREARIAAGLT